MTRGLHLPVAGLCYLIFFATFPYLIAFTGDLALISRPVDPGPAAARAAALLIDVALPACRRTCCAIRYEEHDLTDLFGQDYDTYRTRVGMLAPGVAPERTGRFSPQAASACLALAPTARAPTPRRQSRASLRAAG